MSKTLFLAVLLLSSLFVSQSYAVDPPPGGVYRIGYSADGNQHDADDWHASPLTLAMLASAGLKDRLVHFDYNNHLGIHEVNDNGLIHATNVGGAVQRYGYDPSIIFDDQIDLSGAIANMASAINASSEEDRFYLVCAGPMEVCYRGIAAADDDKEPFVTVVSHSNWNNNHSDTDEMTHTWASIGADFNVNAVKISDQNETAFKSSPDQWEWLKQEPDGEWLFDAVATQKKAGDASDTGSVYYVITGQVPGSQNARMVDIQNAFKGILTPSDKPDPNPNPLVCSRDYQDNDGYIIMETENTWSPLDLWIVKTDVAGYEGSGHLEFTGNKQSSGPAKSPLNYVFRVREGGLYRLIIRARKRLDGAPSDNSNDAYVRVDGDYTASPDAASQHNADATIFELRKNVKFFGGNANGWGWAQKLDLGGHNNKRIAVYNFKAGETYTLTIHGRSKNFNMDRIVFFKQDRHSVADAQATQNLEETKCTVVSNLKASLSLPNTVQLTWSDDSDDETQMLVKRGVDGGDLEVIATLPADTTSYQDTVTPGATYTYQIEAINDAGVLGATEQVDIRAPALVVEYANADNNVGNNHIKPHLKIVNLTNAAIAYADVKVRYWFTSGLPESLQLHVDYAQLGNANVQGNFLALEPAGVNANNYLELTFNAAAGEIPAGGNSGPIQLRFNESDWSNFDESDDHSYGTNSSYTVSDTISVYLNDEWEFGNEPMTAPVQKPLLRVLSKKPVYEPLDDNHIKTHFEIVNDGNQSIALSDVSLRYWFTGDSASPSNFFIDFADMGFGNVQGSFVVTPGVIYANADQYLEITFSEAAGMLPAFGLSGKVESRWSKADWSMFDESDDYSLLMATEHTDNDHFTAYVNDQLVWGTEPPDFVVIPAKIEAEDFTDEKGVELQNTQDIGGGLNLYILQKGDWAEYRISVPEAGDYQFSARVSTKRQGGTINLALNGSPIGSVEVEDALSNGWQDWYTTTTTVTLPEGEHTLRLNISGGGGRLLNINWIQFD